MSVGGIFCQCELGGFPENPRLLPSINKNAYSLFGSALIPQKALDSIVEVSLWKSAYAATSKYISNKKGRDFKNDTIDLLRSMGCAIFHNGNFITAAQFSANKAVREIDDSYNPGGLIGGLGIRALRSPRIRKHPAPYKRFKMFIDGMPIFARSGWAVAFVATMPYAARLEKGYGYRVLIGNINSVINAFYRDFWPEKRKKIWYGYCFEKGGFELDTAMADSVNSSVSKSSLAPTKR